MVKDLKYGKMVKNIRVSGLKISCVVKVVSSGRMVALMLDYLIKMLQMAMVFSNGQVFKNNNIQMVRVMKVVLNNQNQMGREKLSWKMERLDLENGMKDS